MTSNQIFLVASPFAAAVIAYLIKLIVTSTRRKQSLSPESIYSWTTLSNKDFSVGLKHMGEFQMGWEWAKLLIAFKMNKNYMNFGDIPFCRIGDDNFFLQTSQGNHIIVSWLFFREHIHITPVVFDLVNRSYKLIDTTRILQPVRLWQENNRLIGEFRETTWVDSKSHEELVSLEVEPGFKAISTFYSLNPTDLPVAIYKWHGKGLTITKK